MSTEQQGRYLAYIRDAIHLIEQRTAAGRQAFFEDDLVQDAVIRRLETLADATGRLTSDVKERHPEIPWRAIIDFRNRVAHGYLDVNLEVVWDVIETDLPGLKAVVDQELEGRGPDVSAI